MSMPEGALSVIFGSALPLILGKTFLWSCSPTHVLWPWTTSSDIGLRTRNWGFLIDSDFRLTQLLWIISPAAMSQVPPLALALKFTHPDYKHTQIILGIEWRKALGNGRGTKQSPLVTFCSWFLFWKRWQCENKLLLTQFKIWMLKKKSLWISSFFLELPVYYLETMHTNFLVEIIWEEMWSISGFHTFIFCWKII